MTTSKNFATLNPPAIAEDGSLSTSSEDSAHSPSPSFSTALKNSDGEEQQCKVKLYQDLCGNEEVQTSEIVSDVMTSTSPLSHAKQITVNENTEGILHQYCTHACICTWMFMYMYFAYLIVNGWYMYIFKYNSLYLIFQKIYIMC